MALSAGSDPIATYELYWRSFRDPGKRGRFSNSRLVRGDDHFQPSLD